MNPKRAFKQVLQLIILLAFIFTVDGTWLEYCISRPCSLIVTGLTFIFPLLPANLIGMRYVIKYIMSILDL